ncbi:MAG TPA: hypothetical protein VGK59_08300 [Ohtaekwangia sp.]
MSKRSIIATLLALASGMIYAQPSSIRKAYRIEGDNIVLILEKEWPRQTQENVLEQSGMKSLSLDTLWKFGSIGGMAKNGWKLSSTKTGYRIYKPVSDLSGDLKFDNEVVLFSDLWFKVQEQTRASFGYNAFKKTSIYALKNGKRRFHLPGYENAREVYLSGTFNNWSTLKTPMIKSDSGWVADVLLNPGKHVYKYIIDAKWIHDERNALRESDGYTGFNSVYFMTNYEFYLKGYQYAKEVVVSGSFNNWKQHELRMKKTGDGWKLQVYLKDGTYEYKFIVDKDWIRDPANPNVSGERNGIENSFLQLGPSTYFRLDGFKSAKQVMVAGEFNGWNDRALQLKPTATGWELPYVLAAGNYQYKFIVDGQWITDPANPHFAVLRGFQNSLVSVQPNHTFTLRGHTSARNVECAGTFNKWTGYTMKKIPDGWEISLNLQPGKVLYKFVIDGQWIIDPSNELWEQNEHGTGNSVLWIAPQ